MAKKSTGRTATQNKAWQEGKMAPTIYELARRFGSEEACEEAMLALKFPGGFVCTKCGHAEYARVKGRR